MSTVVPKVAKALKSKLEVSTRVLKRELLQVAQHALTINAAVLRQALTEMNCHPRELTSVLAAIDHVLQGAS